MSQYKDDTVPFHQFSLHQVYMTNSDKPPKTSSLYNVLPTSHTSNIEFFKTSNPNAKLITQRPSKVPIHYRDKLNTLPKELENYNIIKQMRRTLDILTQIQKELSDESWSIEPLAPQLARANKK